MRRSLLKIIQILPLISLLVLSSCWDNKEEHDLIVDNYFVGWNDLISNRAILEKKEDFCCKIIVSSYVFAVGHNSDFIIVKQHPNLNDLSIIKFFIIDIESRNSNDLNSIFGPMDKNEFDKKSNELNISHLQFNQIYPENPN